MAKLSEWDRRPVGAISLLAVALACLPGTGRAQVVPLAPAPGPVGANVGSSSSVGRDALLVELQGDEPLAQMLMLRFMSGHPDLLWRLRGREYYQAGNYALARKCFELGARYADKPSQAMLGEMYWEGEGGPLDRALGYAWMDLAAERLYEDFYVQRERYWTQLDVVEREEALRRGRALVRKYGDEKAKARLARVLRRERPGKLAVGGFFGNLPILPPSGAGRDSVTLRASEYFDDTFWDPDAYFAWQDTIWKTLNSTGTVEVGLPQRVTDK
ncbi:MAG: SEL1-like repeat protein [Pseudoxanthomonas sp.]|nr:SEL1-like repeat protein [Pseudoxanthomonas sp.]